MLWILFLCLYFCPAKNSNTSIPITENNSTLNNEKPLSFQDSIQQVEDTIVANQKLETDSVISNLDREVVIDSSNIGILNDSIKNKACIIIVGSFIKKANAIRLSKQLSRSKYIVYNGNYGQFNRVGVTFNCFQQDLKLMLDELKKQYHPDAWVLKY